MIFRLHKHDYYFPDPSLAEPDGLLAIGGDLHSERLITAYNAGIFPWFSEGEPICWYAPHWRCVIFGGQARISRSMQKIFRNNNFIIKKNTAFREVIHNCRSVARKDQPGTWITNEMEQAYIKLHDLGIAQSFEAYMGNELAGGMYGLEINGVFCGESMFSNKPNASKAVLIHVTNECGYKLLDCQIPNDHLMRMGATMISRKEYLSILQHL